MDLVEGVRQALRDCADPQKAPGMQAYMKSDMPFLGIQKAVRTRALRPVLAAPIERDTGVAAVLQLWDGARYREERYAAIALLRRHRDWLSAQDEVVLRHLITTGAWWDLVDEIATKLVGPLRMGLDMRAWATDEDLWIRRAAILCQIGAKTQTDPDLLAEVIQPNTADRTFWITKAIGWALRDYARHAPAAVREFVGTSRERLSPLSVREATKHLTN